MNAKQKLYLAAHEAAKQALEMDSKEDRDALKAKAFTDGGFDKQDRGTFNAHFDDEMLKFQSYGKIKLPSEVAAERAQKAS